jgi:hypothetical protein
MAQHKWSFISHSGKQYLVGVFHGAKTGHLLIYINSKIVQIDFKVYEDALYSFFIDEELCEVSVKRKMVDLSMIFGLTGKLIHR